MTSSRPPMGQGPRLVPFMDVADSVVPSVVEELTREGIATRWSAPGDPAAPQAPTTPSAGSAPPVRIFVEPTKVALARAIVMSRIPQAGTGFLSPRSQETVTMSNAEVDAAWSALISDWESDPASAPDQRQGPPPGSGLSSRLIRRHGNHEPVDPMQPPPADEPTQLQPSGPRDYAVADDDVVEELLDEGFTPPEPPPLPRPRDTFDRLAWGGAIGGPVLLVVSHVMSWGTWLGGIGVAAFIGGFIGLVARMRTDRDHDDPGAVV